MKMTYQFAAGIPLGMAVFIVGNALHYETTLVGRIYMVVIVCLLIYAFSVAD